MIAIEAAEAVEVMLKVVECLVEMRNGRIRNQLDF